MGGISSRVGVGSGVGRRGLLIAVRIGGRWEKSGRDDRARVLVRADMKDNRERMTFASCIGWRTDDVRKLYRLARWLRMRDEVIREQPFCTVCLSEGRRMITQEIDHIVPHEGDVDRFWDRANLQGLCKGCHSRKTRSGR